VEQLEQFERDADALQDDYKNLHDRAKDREKNVAKVQKEIRTLLDEGKQLMEPAEIKSQIVRFVDQHQRLSNKNIRKRKIL
jgi:lysozyme family protein